MGLSDASGTVGEAIFKLRPTLVVWPRNLAGMIKGEEYQRVTWRDQGGQGLMESNLASSWMLT